MKPKHPAGPPMTLGNMRELGVQRLVAYCLNDACHHTAPSTCRAIRLKHPVLPLRWDSKELDSFRGGGALASRDSASTAGTTLTGSSTRPREPRRS